MNLITIGHVWMFWREKSGNVSMSEELKIIDIVVQLCFTKFSKFVIQVFNIHVIDNGKNQY